MTMSHLVTLKQMVKVHSFRLIFDQLKVLYIRY